MAQLKNKTLFITGASRGIGKAIALRAARDGANIVIASKTDNPHPVLAGTIYSAAKEIQAAGGQALAIKMDLRFPEEVNAAVQKAAEHFGGIDILVNNASAIQLTKTAETPMKRFDLMQQVNVRGTFCCTQACLPYLQKSPNPHVLTISPPLNMHPKWFKNHVAYTISKYGMSMCVLGMAEEFKPKGIAVNALWPYTIIDTAALTVVGGKEISLHARKPEIMADAAYSILTQNSRSCTGNFFIDEAVLREQGQKNFSAYAVAPGEALQKDYFLD